MMMMLMMMRMMKIKKPPQLNNLRLENNLKSWRSPIKVDDGMNEEMDAEDGEVVQNGEADLDLMVRVMVKLIWIWWEGDGESDEK